MKDYYKLSEASKILRLQVRTMRNWIKDGRIFAFKPAGGKFWLIPASEINRVMEERKNYGDTDK